MIICTYIVRTFQQSIFQTLFCCFALICITSCSSSPRRQILNHTTLSTGDLLELKNGSGSPNLVVITDLPAATKFVQQIQGVSLNAQTIPDSSIVQPLLQLDYAQSIAVVVLQGVQPSTGYNITVQRVVLIDKQLHVDVNLTDPSQGGILGLGRRTVGAMITAPYQLISIPKEVISGKIITFSLIAGNTTIATAVQSVP